MTDRRWLAPVLLLAVTAAVCGAGCRGPASEVRVGSKKFTESVVLGEIATQVLRGAGTRAEHRAQLGGTQVLWHALLAREIDVYPEYTGTIREDILHGAAGGGSDASLREALAAQGVGMSGGLGFDDSYAIGLKDKDAASAGVARLSDLSRLPALRLAFSEEFLNRHDGWPLVRERYGLPQKNVRSMDHDLAYRALAAGEVDAIDLYTTDAEIPAYDLRVLEDDLQVFPRYRAVFLYRLDLPERSASALRSLAVLEGRLSARDMQRLNGRAKLDHVPEPVVAADFLAAAFGMDEGAAREGRAQRVGRRVAEHLALVAASLIAAIVVAIPLGIAAARRRRLGAFLLGTAGVVQTIPSLALLVLLIPLFGIGTLPAVAALFLYSVLPIVRNTVTGLHGIPVGLLESADVLGLSPWARLAKIELPLASPSILAGIQTSAIINVGTATLGALIGAGGLGQPILTGIRLDDLGLILEGAIPAAALALLAQGLFAVLARWIVPRGLRLRSDA
ncbi:MAG TPA: glycine betaine ABC transporter substrate-binding protein [Candidatus Polarisedimenticolia bacterium]|jgi:osmoprotectant transport system permease protein|nr:glycine betaine ABC transporter substrate-binding protein [Candidatus Polarisedimenticolia bacterium]